jgi:vanillate/3-O-methylgallate O-demethylase
LQEAIDQAGSPMRLLWKPDAPRWTPPVVKPEYTGWRGEQSAAYDTVALSDLSHHMWDLVVAGPDALRLLSEHSINNFDDDNFAIGQAKQSVMVTEEGLLVGDNVLTRDADLQFTLSGVPFAQNWIRFHAEVGGYDVELTEDLPSSLRGGADPDLFRYQVQGPNALELVARVFGAAPKTPFFHSAPLTLNGRTFRALRHGMTGQPGYEFIGDWRDGAAVKDALLQAGGDLGLVQVGARAYATNAVASGWFAIPTPAIYTAPQLKSYRESISFPSFEALNPLAGSYFSADIEDYYASPYEVGYGRLVSFGHDFVGREALQQAQHDVRRQKVTLVLDSVDAKRIWGDDLELQPQHDRFRVEAEGKLVGMTVDTTPVIHYGTVLALALVNSEYAAPGTEVTFVWGSHPGAGTDPDADAGFTRIRATVQPSPFNEFARTGYRRG